MRARTSFGIYVGESEIDEICNVKSTKRKEVVKERHGGEIAAVTRERERANERDRESARTSVRTYVGESEINVICDVKSSKRKEVVKERNEGEIAAVLRGRE